MLKLIMMLDCNICGQPFDRVTTSTDRDPMAWKALSQDLEYEAECRGWSFWRAAHHCGHCITDVMFVNREAGEKAAQLAKKEKAKEIDDDNEIPF